MEIGLVRSPLPSYTAITPVTRAPERIEPAAKTDLPAGKTVAPTSDGSQSRRLADDKRDTTLSQDSHARQLIRKNVLDPESDTLIYMATDSESGEVVRQVPSETLRRLRAYAKSISEQTSQATQQYLERTI